MNWNPELRKAVELAEAAGDVICNARESGFEQSRKADNSLVTSADLKADKLVRQGLMHAFPNDAILTEESGWNGAHDASRIWVVDPLDGTRAFAQDEAGYSVLIGLIEAGKVIQGVAHFPRSGKTFMAMRGGGAFTRVRGEGSPALLKEDPGPRSLTLSPSTPEETRKALLMATELEEGPVLHGAGAKLICLAEGGARAYFSGHGLSVWDTAAPGLILEEAGGILTDDQGRALNYREITNSFIHSGGIVASVHLSHEEVLTSIQSLTRESGKTG